VSGLLDVAGGIVWAANLHSSATVDAPDRTTEELALEPARRATGMPPRKGGRRPSGRGRRGLLVLATVVATLALTSGVIAFFTAGSEPGSGGAAQAGALDAGVEPVSVATDRDVTVTWEQSTPEFLTGPLGDDPNGAGGYLVTRYAEGVTVGAPAGDDCDGLRRGSSDPLGCEETALPTGRWQYTVTPKYYNWHGAESDKSDVAVIAPEAPTTITLVNGGGQANTWINQANEDAVEVDVALPAMSLASDTVQLTISDGTYDVSAELPATAGAGTVHFTALDVSSLEDGPLTFTAKVESAYGDFSGNTLASYDKDATSPTVVVSPDRNPDHNGWYNTEVTFSTSPGSVDNGSGLPLDGCEPDVMYMAPDGTDLTVALDCTDVAGNTAAGTSAPFDFDDTNPEVTAVTPDRVPDHNGWYNAAVAFTASGTDATSDIDACESSSYPGPDGSALTTTRSCTDNAGNTGSGTSAPFDFDDTDPSVSLTPARDPDHNGWYNVLVVWTPSQEDETSGPGSCQPAVDYAAPDSASASVARTCMDVAGNVGSASVTFKFDDTDPVVTLTPDRGPDHNTWYNAAVDWAPSQTDATSGPSSCQPTLTYTAPDSATATVTRTCADNAGNVGSKTELFKFDETDPVVTVSAGRAPDHNGWYNAPVTFTPSALDPTSGVNGCEVPVTHSGPDGTGFSVTRTCTDNAGNTGSGTSATYKYDNTNPTVALSLTAAGSASISGTTISYKRNESSSSLRTFRIRAAVSDDTAGAASASFPAIATSGWTHNAEGPISTPAGGPYDSSVFTWTTSSSNPSGYSVSFADQAGNSASQAVTFVNDQTAPALTTLEMFDVDANGKVDRVVATFNEALAPCTAPCTTGWDFDDPPSGGTLGSVAISGSTAILNVTEGGGAPTTAVGAFDVGLTTPNGIRDATGNFSSFADTDPVDKAAPARISLDMRDGNTNGRIDTIVAVFSESLALTTATAPWTLTDVPSGGALSAVSRSGATVTLTISEGAGAHDTSVGSFTIALTADPNGVRDAAGNQSSFGTVAPTDDAGPVPVSITDTNGATDGRIESGDSLIVTFSEAIASTVGPGTVIVETDPFFSSTDTLSISGLTNGARDTGANGYVNGNFNSFQFSGSTLVKSNGDRTITATVAGSCSGDCTDIGTQGTPANFNFQATSSIQDAAGNGAVGTLIVAIRLF
jgi:hypothetical protein